MLILSVNQENIFRFLLLARIVTVVVDCFDIDSYNTYMHESRFFISKLISKRFC